MLLKVLGVNIVLFAVYVMLIVSNSSSHDRGFNIAIGMGVCVFIQVVLNLVIGRVCMVLRKRESGRVFLVSAAVLALVSFVTWLILLSIFGKTH